MFNSHDIIKVNKVSLSGEDLFVLSSMYLPLIGTNSYSIFLLLNNLNGDERQVKTLLDMIGNQNPNLFTQSVAKLEGIGLVKKYYNEEKGYLLQLLSPISGKAFLKNDILKQYLYNQIGDVEVHNLEKRYREKKISGYTDMTLSFDEVFKPVKEKNIPVSIDDSVEIDNIKVKNQAFDYLVFKMAFSSDELSGELLNDVDFENNILKISYQYQLNEQEMYEAVKRTMAMTHDLRYEDIAKSAGYIYQNKEQTTVLGFEIKEAVNYEHNLKDDEKELIRLANNLSIAKMLEALSGIKPALAELNDFNKLQNLTGLPNGVINILIFYINKVKQGEPVNYTYIEKIARSWMKAGVKTAEDAVLYMGREKEKTTTKARRQKKVVEEPNWLKEDYSGGQELTDEEMKEAEALASKLLGK